MKIGKWKFFERFDIEDLSDPNDIYLSRWNVLTTPWFGIKVHHIRRPDADRAQHDHPWSFATLILRGGYVEEMGREHKIVRRRPGSFAYHPAEHRHRIDELLGSETWTLVFSGPKRPNLLGDPDSYWGFWVTDDQWMYWKDYIRMTGRVPIGD